MAPTATRKATRAETSLFVIISISGGCECCAEGYRETVLPAAPGRTRDDVRELLAYPHRVHFTKITLHVIEDDKDLTREQVTAYRARMEAAGQLALF